MTACDRLQTRLQTEPHAWLITGVAGSPERINPGDREHRLSSIRKVTSGSNPEAAAFVDPYYLTHKTQELGYHPEVILAGRRINDNMGFYVAAQVVKLMAQKGIAVAGSRILVMGLAFKENCPDVRKTRVVDIVSGLASYNAKVDVYDPCVNPEEARHEYGIGPVHHPEAGAYDAIIVAVAHDQFKAIGAPALCALGKPQHVLYDLKYALPAGESDLRL